jgi:hypothetical protein
MVLYICKKCNKHFNKKQCYDVHTNRKFPCSYEDITNKKLDDTNTGTTRKTYNTDNTSNKTIELEQKNKELEIKIKQLEEKNIILENKNKTINELYKCLLDKCLDKTIKNKKISNNNCHNTNNYNDITNNNTINNINVKLVPFGMENLDDLTSEEKKTILNAGMFCSVMCAKKLNCNPRLPQYQNIAFTNLRSNDAKIYDKDKTWKTVDKEDLFETVIPRRIDDVNLLIENEEIKISPYMEKLIQKGTEEDDIVKDEKVKKRFHRTVYDFNQNKNKNKNKKTITK